MKNRQTGFTLIELIVVILILSILAATALPRFIDVTGDAHIAAVKGAAGGLGSSVALGHAQWVANQSNAAAQVTGFGNGNMRTNTAGWLVNNLGTTASTAIECQQIWENSMLNPPAIGATGDFTTANPTGTDTDCVYTYRADTSGVITYDTANGSVVITSLP